MIEKLQESIMKSCIINVVLWNASRQLALIREIKAEFTEEVITEARRRYRNRYDFFFFKEEAKILK